MRIGIVSEEPPGDVGAIPAQIGNFAREARRLGVTGWVKNRNDGSVEILAEGDEDAIKEIVSWSHHGPSAARVDGVDVRWRSYTGEFADFRIEQ